MIIAYVHGPRYENYETLEADKITHVNYAFANIEDGKVIEGHPEDSIRLQKLVQLRSKHPHLKLLISVGGWSWSDHFSDAALTAESREVFAQSAVDFMSKYQLDGVDLDWEYPGQLGEDNVFRPEDRENFTLMLQAVRQKLDELSRRENRPEEQRYLLTIATGANQAYLDHTNMSEAHKPLDFVNIMTYDYFTGGSGKAGHHANLYQSSTEVPHQSSDRAVKQHLAAGIPANKLVLGAAFYGRGWKVSDPDPKLYGDPREAGFAASYHQVDHLVDSLGFVRMWDDAAKAPYLWQADSMAVFTFDDPESLKYKCDYLKDQGLAGIMFWEYSGDKDGELLQSIYTNLRP